MLKSTLTTFHTQQRICWDSAARWLQNLTAIKLLKSSTVANKLLGLDLLASFGLAIGGIVAGCSTPLGLALMIAAGLGGIVFLTSLAILHHRRSQNQQDQDDTVKGISAKRRAEIDKLISYCQAQHTMQDSLKPILLEAWVMQKLKSEAELQYVLTKYGPDISYIKCDQKVFTIRNLDVSNCANLDTLLLDDQDELRTLTGLEKCQKLDVLTLSYCSTIDRFVIGAIAQIGTLRTLSIKNCSLLSESGFFGPRYNDFAPFLRFEKDNQPLTIYLGSKKLADGLADFLNNLIANDKQQPRDKNGPNYVWKTRKVNEWNFAIEPSQYFSYMETAK